MDFIQKTVVLVKPDGVKRGLVGDIVSRFERVGLKIVALKMVWVEKEIVASHYKDEREYLTVIGMRSLDDYKNMDWIPMNLWVQMIHMKSDKWCANGIWML